MTRMKDKTTNISLSLGISTFKLGLAILFIAVCVIGLLLKFLLGSAQWLGYQRATASFDTNENIELLVVDSPEKRTRGLSNSQSLESGLGMLFVFDWAGNNGFWMKDMKYPIDMFWFDDAYQMVHSERNVSPDTFPQSFGDQVISRYVLETNPGELGAITKINVQK